VTLSDIGWNPRLDSLFHTFRRDNLEPARVIRVDRGRVITASADGEVAAVTAGRLDPGGEDGSPTIGDWVALDRAGDLAVIRGIVPRTSTLARRAAGSDREPQLLAANVDLVLVVEALDRGANPRRIERAVAMSWHAGATPTIVLAKADLAKDLEAELEAASAAAPFVELVCTSSVDGMGMEALRRLVGSGVTAVMLGPSGAGKSTLANAMLGRQLMAVADVRDGDGKGRHTTTRRELVALPTGGCLIDTPGLRELGLWLTSEAVDGAFPDIEELAADCRFGDCLHETEPGCTVTAAVRDGALDAARLAGYHRLRREAERLERIGGPRGLAEARAHDRSFAKMCRAAQEQSRGDA